MSQDDDNQIPSLHWWQAALLVVWGGLMLAGVVWVTEAVLRGWG